MKLQAHYSNLKDTIEHALKNNGLDFEKLKSHFLQVQSIQVSGDFNRACSWVGGDISKRLILEKIQWLYSLGFDDSNIKAFYRRFFKELIRG